MNRKNGIILLLCALLCTPTLLQAQKGLKLGFFALPQNTWLVNTDDWSLPKDEFNHRVTWGMAAAPVVGYNFSDNFGFRFNFVYSLQGQRYTSRVTHNSTGDIVTVTHKQRLHYLKTPLLIGFNTNTAHSKVIFSMYAGFQAALLLKARYSNDDQNYIPDQVLWEDVVEYPSNYQTFNKLDYGPVLDVGVDIKLTYNVMANIHLRADYGLGDAENKNTTITKIDNGVVYKEFFWNSERPATSNLTGGILFGITYTLTPY